MSRFDQHTTERFLAGVATLCDSDAIRAVQYIARDEQFLVQFTSSSMYYTYFATIYQMRDFAQASSKGKWLRKHFPRLN